jgi:hypothetical protein
MNLPPLPKVSEEFELLLLECDSKSPGAAVLAWADAGLAGIILTPMISSLCDHSCKI